MEQRIQDKTSIPLRTEFMALKTLKLLSQALQLPLIEYDERELLQNVSIALQDYLKRIHLGVGDLIGLGHGFPSGLSNESELKNRVGLSLMLSQLNYQLQDFYHTKTVSEINIRICEALETIYTRCYEIKPLILEA
ncbi:MAG: hypothetical protein ACFFBD_01175 [Candidatus Hodarchaeota archaeon]